MGLGIFQTRIQTGAERKTRKIIVLQAVQTRTCFNLIMRSVAQRFIKCFALVKYENCWLTPEINSIFNVKSIDIFFIYPMDGIDRI